MRAFFRVDASESLGLGHLMRCSTLADELLARSWVIHLACAYLPETWQARLEARGVFVHRLANQTGAVLPGMGNGERIELDASTCADLIGTIGQVDLLVVDAYNLDARWEGPFRGRVGLTMAIDDLADRPHHVDVLLDQNFYLDAETRYAGLLSPTSMQLLGPQYALLRPQFATSRQPECTPAQQPRLLVALGGGNAMAPVLGVILDGLGRLEPGMLRIDLVLGNTLSLSGELAAMAASVSGLQVHGFIEDMAGLMAQCDLAIGAGGSSTLERLAVGLPSLVIVLAENQRKMVDDLASAGGIVRLGDVSSLTPTAVASAVRSLLADGVKRARMSEFGRKLVDGHGARRTVALLEESLCSN